MACKLLDGVTVVAASMAEAGPVVTQILAFLGADVYHIERPSDKEEPRHAGFVLRNSNKKDITLNTKEEEGKEILWRLIEKADVFFENFAPGAWDKMGFNYEEVRKRNPGIIYATLKGFSNTQSRWKKCVAFDPVATCSGGNTYVSGYEGQGPMMCNVNIGDSGGALHGAMEVALAILNRKITGKGTYLECPMQNAVTSFCRDQFAEYYAKGSVRRSGNSYKGTEPNAPHNVYPCQGGDPTGNYVMISCGPDDFGKLCKAIGREELASVPEYATARKRYENRFALDHEIRCFTMTHTKFEVMDILAGQYGIACGAVMSPGELVADSYVSDNILKPVEDELIPGGRMHMPSIPVKIEGEPIEVHTCGAHGSSNADVYMGILGMSEEELEELRRKKII